jgi:hypothetical protein
MSSEMDNQLKDVAIYLGWELDVDGMIPSNLRNMIAYFPFHRDSVKAIGDSGIKYVGPSFVSTSYAFGHLFAVPAWRWTADQLGIGSAGLDIVVGTSMSWHMTRCARVVCPLLIVGSIEDA